MKVLVVDDDRVLADLVGFTFRREGYEVLQAYDGNTALQRWMEEQPDLIILDVNLPGINGFAVCQQIRAQDDVPIILLTVRGEEDDVIYGLQIGADDYVAKPFSPRQLVARAQAVMRRVNMASVQPTKYQVGDLELDPNRRTVRIGQNKPVTLSRLQYKLLDYLALNAGHVLTAGAIIDHVWGPQGADNDTVRQLVRRLRSKIEPDPDQPQYIETVPGLGYGLMITPERD